MSHVAFVHKRRVEFADTDVAGIAHFSRFFCYAEEAEHAFLRSIGLSVHSEQKDGIIGFPRLRTQFEFERALRFEDEVEIRLEVRREGTKRLVYKFSFFHDAAQVATGEFIVVCCLCHADGRIESVALPPEFAKRIDAAASASPHH